MRPPPPTPEPAGPGTPPPPQRRVRPPLSLALRLTLSIGAAVSLLLLALGAWVERSVDQHFMEMDAEELAVAAQALRRTLEAGLPAEPAHAHDEDHAPLAHAVQGHHGLFHWVVAADGRVLLHQHGPDLAAQLPPHRPVQTLAHFTPAQLFTWEEGGAAYRGVVLRLPVAGASGAAAPVAVLATAIGAHQHFLASFRRGMGGATSLAALLAIALTWAAVYRGHAPLRQMEAQIAGISASALHVRLVPQQLPIELRGLAGAFNTMLERVEHDFQRLSHFSADIAHELRTPLTNLSTQTQVLLARPRSAEAYREALYSSLEELERMSSMVADMLYLAQTDHHLLRPGSGQVTLAHEVAELLEYFEPWAEERQVRLTHTGQAPPVPGDRAMLRRALSNLLANAIRHTPPGQAVAVHLAPDAPGGAVSVSVRNPGEGIAPEHLPHLFERFYRVDPSRQRSDGPGGEGTGLGLAIVQSIVEAHGGRVAVRSQQAQAGQPGWVVFSLWLPLGPPGPPAP